MKSTLFKLAAWQAAVLFSFGDALRLRRAPRSIVNPSLSAAVGGEGNLEALAPSKHPDTPRPDPTASRTTSSSSNDIGSSSGISGAPASDAGSAASASAAAAAGLDKVNLPFELSAEQFCTEYRPRGNSRAQKQKGQRKTTVWAADSSSRGIVAVKSIKLATGYDKKVADRHNTDAKRDRSTTKYLARLDEKCPYIVEALNISPLDGSHLHIAMEQYADGDLFDFVVEIWEKNGLRMSEDEIRHVFRQMALSVKFLHDRHIAHRDVKLENFVVKKKPVSSSGNGKPCIDHVKMIDFGHAIRFSDGQKFSDGFCGTARYRAPEIFVPYNILIRNPGAVGKRRRFRETISQKTITCSYNAPPVDVYSLGVSLFMMLETAHPDHRGKLHKLRFYSDTNLFAKKNSEDVKDLVRGMLTDDPSERLTIDEVLEHRWLTPTNHQQDSRTLVAQRADKLRSTTSDVVADQFSTGPTQDPTITDPSSVELAILSDVARSKPAKDIKIETAAVSGRETSNLCYDILKCLFGWCDYRKGSKAQRDGEPSPPGEIESVKLCV